MPLLTELRAIPNAAESNSFVAALGTIELEIEKMKSKVFSLMLALIFVAIPAAGQKRAKGKAPELQSPAARFVEQGDKLAESQKWGGSH